MNVRDQGWRLLALVASLLLHLYLFLNWSDRSLISARESDQPPNSLFVQIRFPQPQPEAQMPVVEPPPPEPVKQPEPPPKPKPKPKPVAKPKPKPVQKPVEKPPEPEQVVEAPAESAPPPPPTASREKVDLRNEFLSRVLAKIEKNKFYPTIARRRNLQGVIQVRFRLGCDGKVEAMEIEGKHSLLRKAAGKAVQASLPLPKIPHQIECPMLIDYAMAYSLEK
jgi:protein TonB